MLSLTYGYNRTGTVSSITGQVNQATVSESNRYDGLSRLTNASITSQGTTNTIWYQYDTVGNRQKQSINGIVTTYTNQLDNNTLTRSSVPGTTIAYSYDPNGNMAAQNVTAGSTSHWGYRWNVSGRLMSVTKDGAVQGTYAYDDKGRKVDSVEGAVTNFYAYNRTETLFQNIYNNYSIDFLYAGSLRVARLDTSSGTGYNTYEYFHVDPLGSTRVVTSSTKSVLFTDSYQPFGQDNGAPTGSSMEKFAGKSWSTSINLYYFYMRWYDPTIGRFISVDPKPAKIGNPQTLNAYVYVLNSPCNHTDPTGACFDKEFHANELVSVAVGLLGIGIDIGLGPSKDMKYIKVVTEVQVEIVPELFPYLIKHDYGGMGVYLAKELAFRIVPDVAKVYFTDPFAYLPLVAELLSNTFFAKVLLLVAQVGLDFAVEAGLNCGSSGSSSSSSTTTTASTSSPHGGRTIVYAWGEGPWGFEEMPAPRPGVIGGV